MAKISNKEYFEKANSMYRDIEEHATEASILISCYELHIKNIYDEQNLHMYTTEIFEKTRIIEELCRKVLEISPNNVNIRVTWNKFLLLHYRMCHQEEVLDTAVEKIETAVSIYSSSTSPDPIKLAYLYYCLAFTLRTKALAGVIFRFILI